MGVLDYGRDLGHLSVSDHPAALTHLIVTGQIGVGDRVLMVNNGAGMSLTVAVIRIETCRSGQTSPAIAPSAGAQEPDMDTTATAQSFLAGVLRKDLNVPAEQLADDANLIADLALDSLAFAVIGSSVDRRLSVQVSAEDAGSCITFGDLVATLASALDARHRRADRD
jgi:acyl carrier protein